MATRGASASSSSREVAALRSVDAHRVEIVFVDARREHGRVVLPGRELKPFRHDRPTPIESFDIGIDVVIVTLVTPGTARARSATCSKNCCDCASV